jgi:hypothetical protein
MVFSLKNVIPFDAMSVLMYLKVDEGCVTALVGITHYICSENVPVSSW